MATQQLILGGGCFWCVEAGFSQILGVHQAKSGYMGGHLENPSYQQICTGNTGHAEVVAIDYDDQQVDVRTLLNIFFTLHNPTELNRQGNDVGTQYRSVLFFQSDAERALFSEVIQELEQSGVYDSPIVTTLEPMAKFYEAEPYHQGYFFNNQSQMYCQLVVRPKLQKLSKTYPSLLR